MLEYALIAAVAGMVAIAALVGTDSDATLPFQRLASTLGGALTAGHVGGICHNPHNHGS